MAGGFIQYESLSSDKKKVKLMTSLNEDSELE